jgi:hypothetical protein
MSSNTNTKPATCTDQAAKDAGFKDFEEFLEAYGLCLHEHTDIEEGKAIFRTMGYLK